MEYIGKQLKDLRISKGLSLEDIEEITKIRPSYLQAIEDENLDKLPGEFYVRAFIKTYAEAIKLDDAILSEYLSSSTEQNTNIPIEPSYGRVDKPSFEWGKWFLGFLLIAIVVFAVYFFVDRNSNDTSGNSDNILNQSRIDYSSNEPTSDDNLSEVDNDNNPSETNEDKPTIKIDKLETTKIGVTDLDRYSISSQGEELKIKLKFNGPCWISVLEGGANGKQLYKRKYVEGESIGPIALKDNLWLHLGNAMFVDIYVNDTKIVASSTGEKLKYISLELKNE